MRSFLRGAFFEELSLNALSKQWWAQKDSNLRPMDYESTALTN